MHPDDFRWSNCFPYDVICRYLRDPLTAFIRLRSHVLQLKMTDDLTQLKQRAQALRDLLPQANEFVKQIIQHDLDHLEAEIRLLEGERDRE